MILVALGANLPADDGAPPWTDDASPAPWFTPIERLHVATGRLDRVGETPVLSAFDAEDGAFDLALRDGALIIANSESGVLRAPWTEDGVTVPEGTTLTPALWEDVPPRPQQLAVLGDRLLILSPHADAVGVPYICP